MKISGFTLVRHGTQFDYPYLESLTSLVPLVDELVVNVGIGEDDTLKRVQEFAAAQYPGKVVIFESEWPLHDPEKKRSGLILSEQTNLALDRCTGDWCIYLQADEVIHEEDYSVIRAALATADAEPELHAVTFDYVHFYGSYDIFRYTRNAYRREVRAIRRRSGARSVGDAQSFRLPNSEKLRALISSARVFHYGWVRSPEQMKEKTFFMDQLYHGDPTHASQATRTPHTGDNYRYKKVWGLRRFRGDHPRVMRERIQLKNWVWDLKGSPLVWSWADVKTILLDGFERLTGYRLFEYRSYRGIRR